MIINGHNHSDFSHERCQDYVEALEEERRKIQVFRRELPLCLELVTQAIETCKKQISGTRSEYNLNGQSECSEQTSSDAPVLEEFIPMKRASSDSDDDQEQESKKPRNDDTNDEKNSKKLDWLKSAQLWNQTPDPPSKEDSFKKVAAMEVNRNGSCGAFHPFKKEKSSTPPPPPPPPPQDEVNRAAVQPASTSSTAETGGGKKKEEKSDQRKARRCWSPELHKRFLQALQQLGGSHVATPKQIRELMKVDGLTNDEVKSHLQKYRLHMRRPGQSVQTNNSTQTPQFLVVGGIWVPPEYAAMATTTTSVEAPTSNGIYTPIASLPPPFQGPSSTTSSKQRHQNKTSHSSDGGCSRGECGGRHSPSSATTSSSTHANPVSPAY